MYRFYLSTVAPHVWGRQYLNRRFFELLRERFRQRLVLRRGARRRRARSPAPSTCRRATCSTGRYWGATHEVRHLHFDVCYYAAIEHCIAHGLARFEPGAGGDYKQLRGFDAPPTCGLHWLAEPRLAPPSSASSSASARWAASSGCASTAR